MINKITDCSVSVVNKCQLQTHVGHCNQILGHILGYSLKISEKSVSKIYIKKMSETNSLLNFISSGPAVNSQTANL